MRPIAAHLGSTLCCTISKFGRCVETRGPFPVTSRTVNPWLTTTTTIMTASAIETATDNDDEDDDDEDDEHDEDDEDDEDDDDEDEFTARTSPKAVGAKKNRPSPKNQLMPSLSLSLPSMLQRRALSNIFRNNHRSTIENRVL